MGLAPLGSVFGDMGRSPLNTLKTVFVELGVMLHRTVFSVIEKA
jgi:K+ transporter